jgi:hypothetical protein
MSFVRGHGCLNVTHDLGQLAAVYPNVDPELQRHPIARRSFFDELHNVHRDA